MEFDDFAQKALEDGVTSIHLARTFHDYLVSKGFYSPAEKYENARFISPYKSNDQNQEKYCSFNLSLNDPEVEEANSLFVMPTIGMGVIEFRPDAKGIFFVDLDVKTGNSYEATLGISSEARSRKVIVQPFSAIEAWFDRYDSIIKNEKLEKTSFLQLWAYRKHVAVMYPRVDSSVFHPRIIEMIRNKVPFKVGKASLSPNANPHLLDVGFSYSIETILEVSKLPEEYRARIFDADKV